MSAIDYDTDVNGPPFTFRIDPQAPLSFKNKFDVQRKRNGDYYLETKTRYAGYNMKSETLCLSINMSIARRNVPVEGVDNISINLSRFDREQQKVYQIPVEVADNQGMKAVSLLTLVIGDKNDNPMAPGSSQVPIYLPTYLSIYLYLPFILYLSIYRDL